MDFGFSDGGGLTANQNGASFAALLAPACGGRATSTNYEADFGFVAVNDPKPTNAPVIFGITPSLGMALGHDAVTVTGLNFTLFGAGPTLSGAIDGNAMTDVNVVSDTLLTAKSPAGTLERRT